MISPSTVAVVFAAVLSTAAMPPISEQARAGLDRALGVRGVYVSEESAYKFTLPRADLSIRVAGQLLAPDQVPVSWVVFSPAMHREAFVNAELVLLEDEVNPAISAALQSGLQVSGLGPRLLFVQPLVLALNVNAEGTFKSLGAAARKVLDEIRRTRAEKKTPSYRGTAAAPSVKNAIDASPLNKILSMNGTASDGIYRAAIGRVELVNGTPLGREMGMSTRITIFGTNEQAFVDADLIVNSDELQRVLLALRTRNLNIAAIRNHLVAEHPQALFVRVWGQSTAANLARSLRYALDVEVGALRPAD